MASTELHRILLVEDDQDIQIVASLALKDLAGFDVEVCSSGQEALLRAPEFSPDLILLDVMMPVLDGPGTLRALRRDERLKSTPVIFMTAKAQPNEVAEYRLMGALDVIVKPFDPLQLGDEVKQIWNTFMTGEKEATGTAP